MARKEITITLEDGRDKGKRIKITEMSAWDATEWADDILLSALGNGLDLPQFYGMANVAQAGFAILTKLNKEDAKAAFAKLMSCCKHLPDPKNQSIELDIDKDTLEEIASFYKLRIEAFKLHVDFFQNAEK